ncbi:hypothetical protein [Streptomonospora litoralis]|uniref:Uncharacterized protein n=1 Tax=Streptomonospora litoralis TaxID=2498135 RepID=A0A4P6PV76_9ACTN|nr:hypothetical protein [Streptomonospora litoralis]QBI51935.1 hypothetical protein EKD16_00570 [Streptomonospora litoralis]
MNQATLQDTMLVDDEFALIVAGIEADVTARTDPFSVPDFEPLEEDDGDEPADNEDEGVDWP